MSLTNETLRELSALGPASLLPDISEVLVSRESMQMKQTTVFQGRLESSFEVASGEGGRESGGRPLPCLYS